MKIPINYPFVGKEEIREVTSVLSEKSLTSSAFEGGKRVQQFENLLSKFVKSKYAIAVNSGTSALQASLYAIDIKPGDETNDDLNYSFLSRTFSSLSKIQKDKILQILNNTSKIHFDQ